MKRKEPKSSLQGPINTSMHTNTMGKSKIGLSACKKNTVGKSKTGFSANLWPNIYLTTAYDKKKSLNKPRKRQEHLR